MAITAETDIFVSKDGIVWSSENFNTTYEWYYDKYTFTNLDNIGVSFVVFGYPENDPGYPLVMFSDSGGELWVFNFLEEINNQPLQDFTPLVINSICEYTEDEVMAACNGGRLLALSTCAVCNLLMTTPNPDFYDIAASENKLLAVGDDYKFSLLSIEDLKPDKISAEQALADFESGALIIDLRGEEEYNQSHVKGCYHVPADELTGKLSGIAPDTDTELIFYCSDGADAQKAIAIAQQLGYHTGFNLGGLSDWTYETE
jgi:rhodanese-related sulfurtransferase